MYRLRCIPLVLALGLTSCAGCPDQVVEPGDDAGAGGCRDRDGDGYGLGCVRGDDCDDADPNLNLSCDCSAPYPGCPCFNQGNEELCYQGPSGTEGVGICRGGTMVCDEDSGRWSTCEGQVLPLDGEVCNGTDDDCDNAVDEGVLNLCGTCDPNCLGTAIGPASGQPFTPPDDDNSEGVVIDDDGNIVLDPGEGETSFHFLYVANTNEGTVSKVDAETLTEAARYTSALPGGGVATGADALPSRTAIDPFGDVWVANRAHQGSNTQGSVTKIAGSACIDRNGDGVVQTSEDLDGDGRINTDPGFVDPAGQGRLEYYGAGDECVLFTVPIGADGSIPRALGLSGTNEVHPAGVVFVGAHAERKIYALDGRDGSLIPSASNPIDVDLRPYGAVVDADQTLYITQQGTDVIQAVRIGRSGLIKSGLLSHNGPAAGIIGSYGIAVDEQGRIWTGGYAGGTPPNTGTGMYRFTPTAWDGNGLPTDGVWEWVDPAPGTPFEDSHSRGVTIHRDHTGKTWAWTGITGGGLAVVDAETLSVAAVLDPPGDFQFIGVGPDFLVDPRTGATHMWAVSYIGNGSDQDIGEALRVTYDYGTHTAVAYDPVPVGLNPYTYSDFTGYGLRSFTTRTGSYRVIVPGCATSVTTWQNVVWEATVPEWTQVCVRAVTLESNSFTAAGTGASPPTCQGDPGGRAQADISALPQAPFLLIEATLTRFAANADSPSLQSLGATFACQGGG